MEVYSETLNHVLSSVITYGGLPVHNRQLQRRSWDYLNELPCHHKGVE